MSATFKGYPPFPHPGDTFLSPADWLAAISAYELDFKAHNPDYPPGDFRGRFHKIPHEAWLAAMFGFFYACAHRLGDLSIRHLAEEKDTDVDAIFRWTRAGMLVELPIQLKELPPESTGTKETLEGLVEKIAKNYPTSSDLIVAVHCNRHQPEGQKVELEDTAAQLWLWGASRDDGREHFLINRTVSGQSTFLVPFDTRVDMALANIRSSFQPA